MLRPNCSCPNPQPIHLGRAPVARAQVRDEIESTKSNSEKLLDSLRASMEECDVRIAEIKKDAYEFKRDIVTGAENFRTGKTIAEKAVRYMEEKLRAKVRRWVS